MPMLTPRAGFTLVEMVMVLVIIGLLASIVIPQFSLQMEEAREAQTRANLQNLRSAIAIYVKRYPWHVNPAFLDDLVSTFTPPLIPVVPKDGWGKIFAYTELTGEVKCDTSHSPKCLAEW